MLRNGCMLALVLTIGCSRSPGERAFPRGELVDLSHAYDAQSIFWPTADPFRLERVADGITPGGYYYAANNFFTPNTAAPTSTPPSTSRRAIRLSTRSRSSAWPAKPSSWTSSARAEDGTTRSPSPTSRLGARARRHALQRHRPVQDRFLAALARRGRLPRDRRSRGRRSRQAPLPRAASRRRALARCPSAAQSRGHRHRQHRLRPSALFETHRALFERDTPAFENLTALDRLPPRGAFVVALPMKIKGGSGAPLRAVAMLP